MPSMSYASEPKLPPATMLSRRIFDPTDVTRSQGPMERRHIGVKDAGGSTAV